jgi:AraC-like DNA-binding protein
MQRQILGRGTRQWPVIGNDAAAFKSDGVGPDTPPSVRQTFRERLPATGLENHVICVWIQQIFPGSAPYTHRTVPNGSVEVVCEVGAAPIVVGPQTQPTEEIVAPATTVVGIRLRPGAAPALLGMPASELLDLAVQGDEMWGHATAHLAEEIATATTPERAAAILEAELSMRLREAPPVDAIVAETVQRLLPAHTNDVSALASSLYMSERQLRRRCEAAVGLTPKVLQRMLRFQRFLALSRQHDRPRRQLARLALEAGYADQSHLSREASRLAGRTPRAILREAQQQCLGAHDHRTSYRPLLFPSYPS